MAHNKIYPTALQYDRKVVYISAEQGFYYREQGETVDITDECRVLLEGSLPQPVRCYPFTLNVQAALARLYGPNSKTVPVPAPRPQADQDRGRHAGKKRGNFYRKDDTSSESDSSDSDQEKKNVRHGPRRPVPGQTVGRPSQKKVHQ